MERQGTQQLCHLTQVPQINCPDVQQASKQRLETAMKALEAQNVYNPDPLIYKTALTMVRSASLNCYNFAVGNDSKIAVTNVQCYALHGTSDVFIKLT